jgi:hypothetical protein
MVLWVRSFTTQQWLILDAEPNPAGNTVIDDGDLGHVLGKKTLFEPDKFEGKPVYMSHWATCPGRKQARAAADAKKGKR